MSPNTPYKRRRRVCRWCMANGYEVLATYTWDDTPCCRSCYNDRLTEQAQGCDDKLSEEDTGS